MADRADRAARADRAGPTDRGVKADTADRPLEPRSSSEPLHEADVPHPDDSDPHHRLNTHVGEIDETTDSDPYRTETPEDDGDRASGIRGAGEGAEDR